MEENKCIFLAVVGNPEGVEASGTCGVLCMTLWEREEDLTQDAVPVHEKGGLELMICAFHATPLLNPLKSSDAALWVVRKGQVALESP